MSMAPLGGLLGSAAGAPLSQTKGSEVERGTREAAVAARAVETAERADRAGGIGQTEQDQQSEERDADGRRPWETPATARPDVPTETLEPTRSKDVTGMAGTQLDLVG
jgi:hypothetical protein